MKGGRKGSTAGLNQARQVRTAGVWVQVRLHPLVGRVRCCNDLNGFLL